MWIKAQDARLINLEAIESISVKSNESENDIVAIPTEVKSPANESTYRLFSGSVSECEITMAEIEAAIVGKVPLLEL
ncbi:MAG: hypothetical protein H6696_00980 [Deferribacteres bacterium]|nr:hypothetical protein [candidate division KSB1 bacterium]MCB9500481.1 hypothetical protein [Deferribacteres bacterium]